MYSQNLIKLIATEQDLDISKFDIKQILIGMNVELEHGTILGDDTDVTGNDPTTTLKIVLAHLKENPNYYTDPMKRNWGKTENLVEMKHLKLFGTFNML